MGVGGRGVCRCLSIFLKVNYKMDDQNGNNFSGNAQILMYHWDA